jgi:hypothetical protein
MAPSTAISATSLDLAGAGWTVGITVAALFIVIVAVGFTILVRRRRTLGTQDDGIAELAKRANILLVRADDAVKNAEDELGFAIAQFGAEKTAEFASTVAEAKTALTRAFALKQRLDDAVPDTDTQRREWNGGIVAACESMTAKLGAQTAAFGIRRQQESDAPASLVAVRAAIADTAARIAPVTATLDGLRGDYAPTAIATVAGSIEQATALLDSATAAADSAEAQLAARASAADTIQQARQHAQQAEQLLDGVDRLATALQIARGQLAQLVTEADGGLTEARAVRDAPPDPDTGAAVNSAIAGIEGALAAAGQPATAKDPTTGIQKLQEALGTLDVALGSARNQQQRLEHARTALVGALLTARSQIATTGDFIAARRGSVRTDARTRLSEAQRLLTIAEAEADPVAALDTARSSVTYSRDADALARYDVLG